MSNKLHFFQCSDAVGCMSDSEVIRCIKTCPVNPRAVTVTGSTDHHLVTEQKHIINQ